MALTILTQIGSTKIITTVEPNDVNLATLIEDYWHRLKSQYDQVKKWKEKDYWMDNRNKKYKKNIIERTKLIKALAKNLGVKLV